MNNRIINNTNHVPARCVLIGLGEIAAHYKQAFLLSDKYSLTAVCDKNEACSSRMVFKEYPFYQDYKKMNENEDFSIAIIATDFRTHKEIAEYFLCHGKDVMVEKPISDSLNDIAELYQTAEKHGTRLISLLHWKYADEVLFLKEHLKDFGKIEKIEVDIKDACLDSSGSVRVDRRSMGGSWYDSGINALSFLDELVNLDNMQAVHEELHTDPISGCVIDARHSFKTEDSIEISISNRWTQNDGSKRTFIHTDKGIVTIYHSEQRVFFNDDKVFESKVEDRLASHYVNMLKSDLGVQNQAAIENLYRFVL